MSQQQGGADMAVTYYTATKQDGRCGFLARGYHWGYFTFLFGFDFLSLNLLPLRSRAEEKARYLARQRAIEQYSTGQRFFWVKADDAFKKRFNAEWSIPWVGHLACLNGEDTSMQDKLLSRGFSPSSVMALMLSSPDKEGYMTAYYAVVYSEDQVSVPILTCCDMLHDEDT